MPIHWLVTSNREWFAVISWDDGEFMAEASEYWDVYTTFHHTSLEECRRWVEERCPAHLTRKWVTVLTSPLASASSQSIGGTEMMEIEEEIEMLKEEYIYLEKDYQKTLKAIKWNREKLPKISDCMSSVRTRIKNLRNRLKDGI